MKVFLPFCGYEVTFISTGIIRVFSVPIFFEVFGSLYNKMSCFLVLSFYSIFYLSIGMLVDFCIYILWHFTYNCGLHVKVDAVNNHCVYCINLWLLQFQWLLECPIEHGAVCHAHAFMVYNTVNVLETFYFLNVLHSAKVSHTCGISLVTFWELRV